MVTTIKHGASKKSLQSLLKELRKNNRKGVDVKKYVGKIKLKKDALKIQKDMRSEWD